MRESEQLLRDHAEPLDELDQLRASAHPFTGISPAGPGSDARPGLIRCRRSPAPVRRRMRAFPVLGALLLSLALIGVGAAITVVFADFAIIGGMVAFVGVVLLVVGLAQCAVLVATRSLRLAKRRGGASGGSGRADPGATRGGCS